MTKKKKIEKSAQKLFSQFGLKKVTTDEIAKDAGISKATIYKFYKNKYEIFHEVVRIETDLMISMMRKAVNKESQTDLRLKAFLVTKINKIHGLINLYKVTRETWDEHWPHIEGARERFMEEEKALLHEILAYGNEIGELNVKDISLHSHILMISLKSLEYPWALEVSGASVDEIVDLIVDTFINGVGKNGKQN
jgi:AcrR family transcriptional regulator